MRFLVSAIPIIILALSFERRLHIFSELTCPADWLLAFIYFLEFLMQYAGQDMSSASDTTLISNIAPIIAPIGAFLLLKEKVRIAQVLGLALGLVGLVFKALPKMSSGSQSSAMGDALLFLASIGYAAFILTEKKLGDGTLGESFAVILAIFCLTMPIPVIQRSTHFLLI